MSSSPVHHHLRYLDYLSNDGIRLREDLFRAMPQFPHYKPLDNYPESVLEALKVGLDLVFIDSAQKLVNWSISPTDDEVEKYNQQLVELEQMGYDCAKLRERFHTLRALSGEVEAAKLKLDEDSSTKRDLQVKVDFTKTKISQLEAELKKLEAALKIQEEEIEGLTSSERRYIDEHGSILQRFRSAAAHPW